MHQEQNQYNRVLQILEVPLEIRNDSDFVW